ncbi:hypothetical protein chiPu_0022777 [Chiloscyllium punctatum]|uniref:Uncharacterized protein n=1 Tax=Chiloscyllium punctatum TaxID=137246 RepID=A0A401TA00_CHIPU|nr:hypothetical protein [Chiloscyllium punctatum]
MGGEICLQRPTPRWLGGETACSVPGGWEGNLSVVPLAAGRGNLPAAPSGGWEENLSVVPLAAGRGNLPAAPPGGWEENPSAALPDVWEENLPAAPPGGWEENLSVVPLAAGRGKSTCSASRRLGGESVCSVTRRLGGFPNHFSFRRTGWPTHALPRDGCRKVLPPFVTAAVFATRQDGGYVGSVRE